ncbi:hypothetical protein [Ureaplasma urealyticum]|uniref:Uncharacterized protein n=1 Tax=Ureaplasma urealyticum serovar 8 str. ATCC 27618 TaxID=626095 RepID=A0ABP2DNK5_UREUR|nr:hypothetical protein [Ureaplasma urealyticum]EEH01548.1 conserved hypothetical protein [Ureaplasma urealyticum serovar 8 str. ATCC 27618]
MINEQKAKLIELKQKVNDFEFELDKYKEEFMRRIAIFVYSTNRFSLFINRFYQKLKN